MEKSRSARGIVAGITKIILSLALGLVCFVGVLIIGFMLAGRGPAWYYHLYTKSDCDLSQAMVHITFVGRSFIIPSAHVRECVPWDTSDAWDIDSAYLNLDMLLPDLTPVVDRSAQAAFKPNELRIFIRGHRPDIERINQYIKLGVTRIEFNTTRLRNGQQEKIYEELSRLSNGLEHYRFIKKPKVGNSADVYVYRSEPDKIEFILRCGLPNHICDCASDSKSLFDNVTYHYCFERDNLPQAIEIDKKVQEFLKKIQPTP